MAEQGPKLVVESALGQFKEKTKDWIDEKFRRKEPKPQELLPYLLAPSLMEIKPDWARFNEMRHRVVRATGYPRHVDDGWLYAFLSKNENYDISIHIQQMAINDTLKYLHNQVVRQKTDLYQSEIHGTPNQALETKLSDTKRLYETLYKGEEKIFRVSLYVDNKASVPQDLDLLTEKCKSNLNSMLVIPKTCNYRMSEAIRSCLPLLKDELTVQQEFSTNSLSATIPFLSSSNGLKEGVLFAKEETTKQPVFIDFDPLPNKHFFVLGASGSGKSYTAKYLLIQLYIALDAKIYVLDPNSEYKELCNHFGGQTVEISRYSGNIINIFDLANEDFGSILLSLLSIFDIIVGGLSESQKSALSRMLILTYQLKGISPKDPATWNKDPPTFSDFNKIVKKARADLLKVDKKQIRSDTRSLEVLANRISMYVQGGVFGFLDQKTRIDLNQRFINFDLSKLPLSVKPLMMFAVLDFMVREIKKDTKAKVLLIDEGWTLLKNKESEGFLLDFIKSSRKYGASIGFITQELEDLLESSSGKSILNQTSTKILMHQGTSNIDLISGFLKLNKSEQDFLVKCQKGHGLLICGEEHTRFFTKLPLAMHEKITTDPAEVLDIQRKKALGTLAEDKKELREYNPSSPEAKIREEEKRGVKLDPEKDYYLVKDLSREQIEVLRKMNYEEAQIEPFKTGVGPKWLVQPHGREGPKHALMMRVVRDEIEKYCDTVILSDSVEPDIVAVHNGKTVAFEIETGSWVEGKKRQMEERFKKHKETYTDGYYIIITNGEYEDNYRPFAPVITKTKIKEVLSGIFV